MLRPQLSVLCIRIRRHKTQGSVSGFARRHVPRNTSDRTGRHKDGESKSHLLLLLLVLLVRGDGAATLGVEFSHQGRAFLAQRVAPLLQVRGLALGLKRGNL